MKQRILGAVALLAILAASSANAQGVKWHPGHYVMLLAGETGSTRLARISEIGKESSIKGVMIRINWANLETSKGVYNFSEIDAILKRLREQPTKKYLMLRIMERRFGAGTTGIVPKYITTESSFKGGLVKTSQGYAARMWEKPVMDRYTTLIKALGARYDGDPNFEGFSSEETTLSLKAPYPSGFSNAALGAQWTRLAVNARPSMPHTNFFIMTNWLGKVSEMQTLVQSLVAPQAGANSSNLAPSNMNMGQEVWSGVHGADYRGRLAIANGVETQELGGKYDYTPKQLNDYAYNSLKTNYIFWMYNTYMGDAGQRWKTGILPFLRTKPPIRTACPSSYGSCVTN